MGYNQRKWNENEVATLRDKFATEDLDVLMTELDRSIRSIMCKANSLGLARRANNAVVDGKKLCTFCREWHDVSEFYRNRCKYDGYEYYCKKYYLQKDKKADAGELHKAKWTFKRSNSGYVGIDRERVKSKKVELSTIDGIEGKMCTECEIWKPLDSFPKLAKGVGGRGSKCKACVKALYFTKDK